MPLGAVSIAEADAAACWQLGRALRAAEAQWAAADESGRLVPRPALVHAVAAGRAAAPVKQSSGILSFIHKTVQEYLAAAGLSTFKDDKLVLLPEKRRLAPRKPSGQRLR